jgi:SAM-dependent methyltransferase
MDTVAYTLMNEREKTFWWYVGMLKIIDSQLKKFVSQKKDNIILDAGCGTGAMFKVLQKYGSVHGIDQSKEAVAFAKAKNIAQEVRLGSISSLPYQEKSFDVVVCLDVLYHEKAGNDDDALREFYRVLRPGGTLIVREPAYNWLRGHQDAVVWTKKRYNKKELVSKIAHTGFGIEKKSYVNFFLLPLAVIKRFTEGFYKQKNITNETFRTNWLLNFVFRQVLFLEDKLLPYIGFPFGLSIMCVARKK